MQRLPWATRGTRAVAEQAAVGRLRGKSPRSKRSNAQNGGTASNEECAAHVLNIVPPVVRALRKLMRHHRLQGLSVPQFRAMALLSLSPRATLSLVADYAGCSLPAASRMIDGLVAKKLVARRESRSDRRQVSLMLTARGQNSFEESREATQQQLAQALAFLEPGQCKTVIQGLQLLAGIFGTDADCIRAREAAAGRASRGAARRGRKSAALADPETL